MTAPQTLADAISPHAEPGSAAAPGTTETSSPAPQESVQSTVASGSSNLSSPTMSAIGQTLVEHGWLCWDRLVHRTRGRRGDRDRWDHTLYDTLGTRPFWDLRAQCEPLARCWRRAVRCGRFGAPRGHHVCTCCLSPRASRSRTCPRPMRWTWPYRRRLRWR
ncbi:hypothetical protein BD413DRAFT_526463 [Trametes elegans]|nr:hypothetical protein BD413DRAFT_526463 [Trametes elegans]